MTSKNERSKKQQQLTKIKKDLNREVFFHFNKFVELIIDTVILRRKIMLRSRSQYEYVTSSHLHLHIRSNKLA
jgi:hypothetical protein